MKYIVVTGGVVSGLGKGVTISSMGRMLQGCGLRVTSIKIDPYLNVDAGTMSPFEHGETYVLDDGGETDLNLCNYERFLSVSLTSVTSSSNAVHRGRRCGESVNPTTGVGGGGGGNTISTGIKDRIFALTKKKSYSTSSPLCIFFSSSAD